MSRGVHCRFDRLQVPRALPGAMPALLTSHLMPLTLCCLGNRPVLSVVAGLYMFFRLLVGPGYWLF